MTTDLGEEDPKPEDEAAPYAEYHTPPEGDYEDFVLPDGAVADEAIKLEFLPIVKELGLSQKGAQKLVDFKSKLDTLQLKNWSNHLVELKATAQKDPEIGGAKYQPAVAQAKAAIAKFGTPGLRKMFNDYGVGNHPEMIRFMAKIGAATGETPALEPGGGAGVVNKPLHEILYKDS